MWRNVLLSALILSPTVLALGDGVLLRSEIARQHMQRIAAAYWIYENENEWPPTPPHVLYPGYVQNPALFWHPGDVDPRPRTINNSTPDALNSAQISFTWCSHPWDCVQLRDNSAANNGGRFVNLYVLGSWFETDPPMATPRPTATEIAVAHLRHLAHSLNLYTNDNDEWFPAELHQLVYSHAPDCARLYWHPGDSDPMPTEITNSEPNAVNSAQVSFEYLLSGLRERDVAADTVALRDNTTANNNGEFMLLAFRDGFVESDPPNVSPVPSRSTVARGHIQRVATALRWYAVMHDGVLPADLIELWDSGWLEAPRSFWNPGDSDPLPTDITNSVPNGIDSALISYSYMGAGLNVFETPGATLTIADNSVDNNAGLGVFAGTLRGQVDWIPDCAGDVDNDERVDWRDLLIVFVHLGLTEHANPEDGDVNGDGDVDQEDLGEVLRRLGQTCTDESNALVPTIGVTRQPLP